MIERVRYRVQADINDWDIAWAIQLYRSRDQLIWCLPWLRRSYPRSRVVLIADGDGVSYEDIARTHGCDLIQGRHLMRLPTCHLYVERLLRALLAGDESYLFRIDPDTKVCRRFSSLPGFSSVFGTLETLSENLRDEIAVPANVQGGCVGLTRDAAEEILSAGVLSIQSCAIEYPKTWARCADMLASAARGRFCDDFVISWAAHACSIPIVEASEVRSRWRRVVSNDDLRYAVTHPHKLSVSP